MNDSKKWFQSKTVWANALMGIAGIVGALSGTDLASDPKVQSGFATTVTIVNVLLRLVTDKPIVK